MIKVIIVSRSKKTGKLAKGIQDQEGFETVLIENGEDRAWLKNDDLDTILYEDISGLDPRERVKLLKSLEKRDGCFGIIEMDGVSKDPADFFLRGASDYVGPKLPPESFNFERFRQVLEFRSHNTEILAPKPEKSPDIPFPGWKLLQKETEYSFWIVFAQPSQLDSIKRKIGETRFNELKETFREMLAKHSAKFNGIPWLWQEHQVIILFPKDASGRSPLEFGLRLLLNRALISYEELGLEIPITFKLALHSGSIPWRETGNTGTVVSGALNYIFHLGHKFAEDGSIFVSETASELITRRLEPFFRPAGVFEGEKILKSRKFLD